MRQWISPEALEVLKSNLYMSPETWHKVMNLFCGQCLAERGKAILEQWRQTAEHK